MKRNHLITIGICIAVLIAALAGYALLRPGTAKLSRIGKSGGSAKVGKVKWTVTAVEQRGELYLDNDPYKAIKAEGVFLVLDVKAEAADRESEIVDSSQLAIVDSQGRSFRPTEKLQAFSGLRPFYLKRVDIDAPASGRIIFDIPTDSTGLRLRITDFRSKSAEKGLIDLGL